MRALPLLLVAALLPGCVTVRFDRRRAFEPVSGETLARLRAGHSNLETCLATLGAPNLVYQQPDGRIAMAWAWLDHFGWGLNASISVRGLSVSADTDVDKRDIEAAVLFFDQDLRLVSLERGMLHDFLRQPRRQPPTPPEIDEPSAR